MSKKILNLVSRKSPLAMWQAHFVKSQIELAHPHVKVQIAGIITNGDRWLDKPLTEIGGKGLFVNELEQYLLKNNADIAVHSMKDLPAQCAEGLVLAAIPVRGDPRDAFVSLRYARWEDLPPNAQVGTASIRRAAQLRKYWPNCRITAIRGNVETRLKKMEEEGLDAIILAAAGLERLSLAHRITQYLEPHQMLPAVGQGALGIQCRSDDPETQYWLHSLHHLPSAHCVMAERSMNARLGGHCHVPVAGYAQMVGTALSLEGRVMSPDGKQYFQAKATGDPREAVAIGIAVAEALCLQGAEAIIQAIPPC